MNEQTESPTPEKTKGHMALVTLEPGAVIHVRGIPLKLVTQATVETHARNVPLAFPDYGPAPREDG